MILLILYRSNLPIIVMNINHNIIYINYPKILVLCVWSKNDRHGEPLFRRQWTLAFFPPPHGKKIKSHFRLYTWWEVLFIICAYVIRVYTNYAYYSSMKFNIYMYEQHMYRHNIYTYEHRKFSWLFFFGGGARGRFWLFGPYICFLVFLPHTKHKLN